MYIFPTDWDPGAAASFGTTTQFQEYRKLASTKGIPAGKAGEAADALAKSTKKIGAEYVFPYLAHAPMEPLNCTVKICCLHLHQAGLFYYREE
ncbi:hypothetical protein A4H97_31245 [Niastella yeongjuensis]|uniref:Uncharacterized protein n=1 Tax=Niastella yeongjuensis TaxID=354355 RepID=A0A1V9EJD4_9BACT|nr:hypothetical protein [Niastella yeongjuensis]OQP46240.1 hypothetical protein A4H97_31245 [Niastella yeongjuensis]SEP46073.1 isoquinoline 1-oxidoreductase, beta subunit [Niastella yeongjuensis]